MASGSVCRNYLVTVTCAFTSLYFLRQQPLLSRTLAVEGGLLDCGSCAAEARERAVRRAFAAADARAADALARLWRHGGGLGRRPCARSGRAPAQAAPRGGRGRGRGRRARARVAGGARARCARRARGAGDAANEIWRNARGGGGAGGGNATDVDAWAAEALEGGGALDLLGDMVCFGGEADVAAAAELVYYVAERSPAARRRLLETATARARRREREAGALRPLPRRARRPGPAPELEPGPGRLGPAAGPRPRRAAGAESLDVRRAMALRLEDLADAAASRSPGALPALHLLSYMAADGAPGPPSAAAARVVARLGGGGGLGDGAFGAALYAAPEPGWSKRDEERVYALNAAAHLAWVLAHRLHGDLTARRRFRRGRDPGASRRRVEAARRAVDGARPRRLPRAERALSRRRSRRRASRASTATTRSRRRCSRATLYASSRADAARPSVAEALGLDNGANVADVDEALTVATASDVSQFLDDAAVLGRPLPRSIKRTATLALALSRVAWHHVAYSAPNVYGLLSVELLANGLVSERWLRRVAPCAEINHRFGWS
ncbi:hypothetical protein JL720_2942 [Aureococcus anophagefferens]|nr:hypothetical protein JL720_2942 [Aureococcus anophagefferens]